MTTGSATRGLGAGQDLLAKRCLATTVACPLPGNDALLSDRMIREVLDFKEQNDWRDEVAGP